MLDAFQSAAINVSNISLGALVPLHEFYPCIESFLDTSVKRSIDQASDNPGLEQPFDITLLQTLFLIRYIDIIKPNVNNLVTLQIDQVDTDRLKLKKDIEESLVQGYGAIGTFLSFLKKFSNLSIDQSRKISSDMMSSKFKYPNQSLFISP